MLKKTGNKWKYEGLQKHDMSLTTVTLTDPQYCKTFTKHTLLSSEKSLCVCVCVCVCLCARAHARVGFEVCCSAT